MFTERRFSELDSHGDLRPTERSLEETYRSLRSGLEAAGNGPSANDLFFEERHWRAKRLAGVDAAVLRAYEIVGGFGVRAWRPLVALVAIVVLAAASFSASRGLDVVVVVPRDAPDACTQRPVVTSATAATVTIRCSASTAEDFEYSVLSPISLTRPVAGFAPSGVGVAIDVALRLAAPALLALALIGLRSRVSRS